MTPVQRYAEIKLEIKILEAELATIAGKVKKEVIDNDGKLEIDTAKFVIKVSQDYTYSTETQDRIEKFEKIKKGLEAIKKSEITSGVAKPIVGSEKETLVCTVL